MNDLYSASGECLLRLNPTHTDQLTSPEQYSEYTILFIAKGKGIYHADWATYEYEGPVLLFSTPLQLIYLELAVHTPLNLLQFHGDFYCIEYHRKEVACNGLLFNNLYVQPCIKLSADEAIAFQQLLADMLGEFDQQQPAELVLRAYLQLFLAKASTIKLKLIGDNRDRAEKDELMEQFSRLLEQHFLSLHKPNDYAQLLAMSPNNFSKRCMRYFKRTPSQLIQERLVLEAKKQLHLTRQSIKEIAYNLKFQDEFYFSRFFKKLTQVSPQSFRNKTGISIVADLSKQ